ncbi:hypothetical protein DL98DRAFT_583248 [Cadophora sp. DSE1049]|nr:hypothetical protein DL98DRAFT_583248 [Cadophora sp. DSE1049]
MADPPVPAPLAQMSGALQENEAVSTQDDQPFVTQEQHVEPAEQDPTLLSLREGPQSSFAPGGSSAEPRQISSQTILSQSHDNVPPDTIPASISHLESTVDTASAARSPTALESGSKPHHRILPQHSSSRPPPPPPPPPISTAASRPHHRIPAQHGSSGQLPPPLPPPPPINTAGSRPHPRLLTGFSGSVLPPRPKNTKQKDIFFEGLADYQINENYDRIIERAAGISDRLKRGRFRKPARLINGAIGVVDYSSSGELRHSNWDEKRMLRPGAAFPFSEFLRSHTDGVIRRLIVVEDLYPSIITFLVGGFGVSPEFFEEHLINSGYGGGNFNDKSPKTWKTSGMKKSYASIKWYRPAWRLSMAPFSQKQLDDLLNPDVGILNFPRGKSRASTVEVDSNIFRLEWDLRTDPRSTNREKRKCGLEERASVWKGKIPNTKCDLVILLLDPLPALKECSVRYQKPKRQARRRGSETNRTLSSQTTDSSSLLTDVESGETDTSGSSQTTRSTRSSAQNARRHAESTGWFKILPEWLLKLLKLDEYQLNARTESVTIPKPTRPVIEHIGSRVPLENTLEESILSQNLAEEMRSKLYDTSSTFMSFSDYVDDGVSVNHESHFGPLTPLYEIVWRDIEGLLGILQDILDGINTDILDDDKMEDRLAIWRQILTRAQLELPQMKHSMAQFFTFLLLDDHSGNKDFLVKAAVTDPGMQQCLDTIDEMILRLQSVSSSLTSNMALLDSRRSIAEAQSITRLTELAFLFIPLTFAATVFGMEIEPFKDPVPLSTFIILAITLSGFSYAARLAIRSSWLIRIKYSTKESIKQFADRQQHPVQGGYIPTTLALRWLYQLIWYHLKTAISATAGFLVLVAVVPFSLAWTLLSPFEIIIKPLIYIRLICVLPLSILWTRELNHEIQVALTVASISSVSISVFVSFWRSSNSETRRALPQLLKREYELFRDGDSVLFWAVLWIGSACVFLVPIALLWSRPTSSGIKAALMTALGLIFLALCATYGIFKFVYISRTASFSDFDSESGSDIDESESDT